MTNKPKVWQSLDVKEKVGAVAWLIAIVWTLAAVWPLLFLGGVAWLCVVGFRRWAS